MAKGKKRASGAPPKADTQQHAAREKIPPYAERGDFSLEAQSVPAEALRPKPTQGDLRLNAGAATRAKRGGAKEEARLLSYRHQDKRKNNPQVGLVTWRQEPRMCAV